MKILVLILVSMLGAYAIESDVIETSYNRVPQVSLICTEEMSVDEEWKDIIDDEEIKCRDIMMISDEEISSLFKIIKFIPFNERFLISKTKNNLLFYPKRHNPCRKYLFVHKQYHRDSLEPIFEEKASEVPSSFYSAKKWKNLRKPEYPATSIESANEMSWKYIDMAIHEGFSLKPYCGKRSMKSILYRNCRNNGIENSILRIAITINNRHEYSFFSLYDTEDQRNETQQILESLI